VLLLCSFKEEEEEEAAVSGMDDAFQPKSSGFSRTKCPHAMDRTTSTKFRRNDDPTFIAPDIILHFCTVVELGFFLVVAKKTMG
jgi:hypothetical protein